MKVFGLAHKKEVGRYFYNVRDDAEQDARDFRREGASCTIKADPSDAPEFRPGMPYRFRLTVYL